MSNISSSADFVRRTYTVEEAAAVLGISRSTAYACVKSGEIPSLRFRRRVVIPKRFIDELLFDQGDLRGAGA